MIFPFLKPFFVSFLIVEFRTPIEFRLHVFVLLSVPFIPRHRITTPTSESPLLSSSTCVSVTMPKEKKILVRKRVPLTKPQVQREKVKVQPVANSNDADESEASASKHLVVKWDNDRTNRLLDWLDQNPDDRNYLFSDLTAAAKQEGRRKVTAKGIHKSTLWGAIKLARCGSRT